MQRKCERAKKKMCCLCFYENIPRTTHNNFGSIQLVDNHFFHFSIRLCKRRVFVFFSISNNVSLSFDITLCSTRQNMLSSIVIVVVIAQPFFHWKLKGVKNAEQKIQTLCVKDLSYLVRHCYRTIVFNNLRVWLQPANSTVSKTKLNAVFVFFNVSCCWYISEIWYNVYNYLSIQHTVNINNTQT